MVMENSLITLEKYCVMIIVGVSEIGLKYENQDRCTIIKCSFTMYAKAAYVYKNYPEGNPFNIAGVDLK